MILPGQCLICSVCTAQHEICTRCKLGLLCPGLAVLHIVPPSPGKVAPRPTCAGCLRSAISLTNKLVVQTEMTTAAEQADEVATSPDVVARRRYYRELCSLPAEIALNNPDRIVLPVGGGIGAAAMSADLGRTVLVGLRGSGRAGPIVEYPPCRRWAFICEYGVVADDVAAELQRFGVTIVDFGHVVILPSLADEISGIRLWVSHPGDSRPLPTMLMVLTEVRDAVGRHVIRISR